jgi:hypothetical protein
MLALFTNQQTNRITPQQSNTSEAKNYSDRKKFMEFEISLLCS